VNILIFGPNGSGKGTQGAIVQKNMVCPILKQVLFSGKISLKNSPGRKGKSVYRSW